MLTRWTGLGRYLSPRSDFARTFAAMDEMRRRMDRMFEDLG